MPTKHPDHVGVRLDEATLAAVEALIPQLSTEWHQATRSDVLRMLIKWSLARIKADPTELRKLRPPPGDAGEGSDDGGEA